MRHISVFDSECSWLSDLRRLWTGKLEIGSQIMEIVRIKSRFPQTSSLFHLGTLNGCSWWTGYLELMVLISVMKTQDAPVWLALQRLSQFKVQNYIKTWRSECLSCFLCVPNLCMGLVEWIWDELNPDYLSLWQAHNKYQ